MDSTDTIPRRGHPPSHWFDTIDQKPTNSFAAKGLRNAPGENNCFLNSAVQVFWHLDVFRRSYRRLTGHLCMGNSCIFCALKVIFTQFQYSDQSSLAPEALRKALAETFINQQRFQLGHMDDACECFENILRRIHFHIANAYTEDACQATHCLPHQKFAMTVFDQIVCSCGASSDPLTFNELVHYISTTALISQCRSMQETGDFLHPDKFGLLLRNAGSSSDIRNCPNTCGKKVQIRRTLLNCPDVVSIGLVWDSERPSTDLINEVCRSIGTTIMLQDVFHSVMVKGVKDVTKLPKLQLSAIVCYYGKHYSTFVFHTKLNVWVYFDDATVREIGPNWEHVVEKCCRGHYQPLLLLYTNPNASPITTETAPKKRVMAPGFSTPAKVPAEKDSRRNDNSEGHQRSSDLKRSITPNPPDRSSTSQANYRSVTPQTTELLNSPDADASSDSGKSEHRRQPSFLIAITGKNARANNKSEYAVPVNNMSIKQRLPGGQNMADPNARKRPQDLQLGQQSSKQEGNDGYYSLSNNDQYRRPSISSPDHNKVPLSQNMHRVSEMQRKESFKRGKDKVGADVIRYVNPRSSSSSSDSDSLGCGESQVPPKLPVKHFRTHSVSYDESIQNRSADNIDIRQHVVMKPKPCGGHVYENIENMNHTPVQSGLATLPRNKKGKQMQSPQYSGMNDHVDGMKSVSHSRESSTHTLTEESGHSRQTSIASQQADHSRQVMQKQSSQDNKPKKPPIGSKPPKPAKPEKRSELMANRKNKQNGNSQNTAVIPEKGSPEHDKYINRKMVESVLHYQSQKLTRQGSNLSCASQSSNTSFDSDTSSVKSQKDGINQEIPFDTLSLESHRDSGYGSSDRNSSSSTGSTTLDPFTQYFLSKSMIPPKNINMHTAADNMRKFINPDYSGQSYNQNYTVNSVHQKNAQDKSDRYPGQDGYESKSTLSKIDQYQDNGQRHPPRTSDHTERKQLYDPAIVKSHGTTAYQVQYQEGKFGPSPTHPKSGDGSNDEYSKLCHKSEELMDQCMLVETSENASMALNYCNAAIDCLKQAMKITTISQNSFVLAQKMHNACVLKARSLQKRLVTRQESTSSTTSSDSARSSPSISVSSSEGSFQNQNYHTFGECCVQRTCNQSQRLQGTHSVQSSIHSRSSSRDSIDSVIENKNYRKDQRTSSANSEKSSQNSDSAHSSNLLTNSVQNIDIYATLPRKGRKNSSNKILSSSQESDSYSRNWSSSSVHHGRTPSSGSLTPTPMDNRESDFSSEDVDRPHYQLQNPTQEQVRSNRAEIRQLQHNNPYHSKDHYPHPSGTQQNENHPAQLCGRQSNEVTHSSRPLTPQMNSTGGHQSDGAMSEPEEFRPSVRDLASRFEYTDSPSSGSGGQHHSRSRSKEPASGLVNRHRSKSESDFRKMDVKPKSVLTRNKKTRGHRPRKSVTFSDNIALVDVCDLFPPAPSSCEDKNSGYISDEETNRLGGSYSDNDDDDSADSPTEIVAGEVACSLCGKKGVQYHEQYCQKCYAYLSQFQTRR